MVDNSKMIAMAMDVCSGHHAINMAKESEPLKQSEEDERRLQVKEVGDTQFFIKKAWEEILLSVYTMIRCLFTLFLDISLCLSYYRNNDIAWFTLTLVILLLSNFVCFLWILSIQYGGNRFKDIKVLIEEEKRSPLGLIDEIKIKLKSCFKIHSKSGSIKTTYHIIPNYRVFYFEDDPDKIYNIDLPKPPTRMSLKFHGYCLPLLALIAQLPTYLEFEYLKWRRVALISLKRDGRKYHEKMVKCVFVKNILQMVLIVSFGERAFQLFLQLYIVTRSNHISLLQLLQMSIGFCGMMFSSVYVQTICSFMNRNLWENGMKAYIGGLMVYVSMMFLALSTLVVVFIYAAIYHHTLAFASFSIFMVFLLSHFTRGILSGLRPIILPVSKILFWVLFGMFIYSNYYWHKCMTNFSDFTSMDYEQQPATEQGSSNTTLLICKGSRIVACNLTALASSVSTSWTFTQPWLCVSVYYDRIYFIINILPYVVLLFAFMSPLYKGFEFYYDYKPRILPGESGEDSSTDEMEIYYIGLERKLASMNNLAVVISVVSMGNSAMDDTIASDVNV